MKKINISLNQNYPNKSLNILKQTKITKTKEIKDNILNKFKKRFQKKKKLTSSRINTSNIYQNTNTKLSTSVPYQHILDDLIKYLHNKINSTLYEDINNYVHKKINTYNLDNKNLNRKRNETDIFSDKKYKSYFNFNLKKNKNNLNANNMSKNIKSHNSIKSSNIKNGNYLEKLMISNDCINKRIKVLRNQENGSKNVDNIESNYKIKQASIISLDNFYNGLNGNLQNISWDLKNRYENDRKSINNKTFENNEILGIKLYNKLKPINHNKARLNSNININLQKIPHRKKIYNSIRKEETKKVYDTPHKNKKIKNLKLFTRPCNPKLNKNKKEKLNTINKTFININKNNISNNYKNDKNISLNLTIGKRSFINNKSLLNKKLINKLKLNLIKNKKIFNNIIKLKNKQINKKKTNLFNEFSNKNDKNNSSLINSNIKLNLSNIKKANSYRLNNSNVKSVSSNKKRISGKTYNKDIVSKLDKNNFLNIVNNITNKKNINDKNYIHINSIEINNIIKSNEQKGVNKEIMESNHIFGNIDIENDELMKKIKNSIDDNLKFMLNFSYENFLSKESDRDSKDFNYNNDKH